MKSPQITVLLPVYNSARFLADAIESILSQSFGGFEFLIIDDGSRDKSPNIIKKYAERDKRIKVITHPKNRGLVTTLNEGVRVAKGKYIARQDADDISLPVRLEKQVEYLQKHPEVGLVGANYQVIDDNGVVVNATNIFTHPQDLALAEIFSNQFGHGTIMARAHQLRQHTYDPDFSHAEDYDLWTRLARETKIANLKEILYLWRLHESGVTARKAAEMRAQVQRIRDREFTYFLKTQNQFSLFTLHPFSMRGGPIAYGNKKASLCRDLALMYCYRGLKKKAVPVLLWALAIAPWSARTYRQLFITLFHASKVAQLEFEVI